MSEISNLSKEEARALYQLIHNKYIVIKPADKGSSVVLMEEEAYIWEAMRQLQDKKYYVKLNRPIYTKTIPVINKRLIKLKNKGFITEKQSLYLMGDLTLLYSSQNPQGH